VSEQTNKRTDKHWPKHYLFCGNNYKVRTMLKSQNNGWQ